MQRVPHPEFQETTLKTYLIHHVLEGGDKRLTLVPVDGKVFGGKADVQPECDRRQVESHHRFEVAEVEPQAAADAFEQAREEAMDAQFRVVQAGRRALLAGAHALFAADPGLESFGFSVWLDHLPGEADVMVSSTGQPCVNGTDGEPEYYPVRPDDPKVVPPGERAAFEARQQAVAAFLRQFAPEYLWDIFDEDSEVTFYRDGRVQVQPLPDFWGRDHVNRVQGAGRPARRCCASVNRRHYDEGTTSPANG
jgi:hypothetical protein